MQYRLPVFLVTAVLVALFAALVWRTPDAYALDVGPEVQKARKAIQEGKAKEAVDMLSRLITLEPQAQLYYYRGIAYSKAGDEPLAIADFTQAISMNPNRPAFFMRRAQSLINCGRFKEASDDLSKALEAEPDNAKALGQRARAYLLINRLEDGFRDVSRAIQLNPGEALLYRRRGDMLFVAGQYKEAVQDYDMAVRMEPGDAITLNNRGVALTLAGRTKEAVEDLNKAMEVASRSALPKEAAAFSEPPW